MSLLTYKKGVNAIAKTLNKPHMQRSKANECENIFIKYKHLKTSYIVKNVFKII